MTPIQWQPGPVRPHLAAGAVDVWCADADAAADPRALLSADERARANRFLRAEHGARWAAARAVLRALLGAYLGVDPRGLHFETGAHGKPQLAGGGRLRFNLSHSADLVLVAIADDREVGIDVELPRRAVDHVAIARRVLGDAEAGRLAAIADPRERERAFLRGWVRWEAVLKCRGVGIGGEQDPLSGPNPWVHELEIAPPAAAALAVEHGPCSVRCWRWPAVGG